MSPPRFWVRTITGGNGYGNGSLCEGDVSLDGPFSWIALTRTPWIRKNNKNCRRWQTPRHTLWTAQWVDCSLMSVGETIQTKSTSGVAAPTKHWSPLLVFDIGLPAVPTCSSPNSRQHPADRRVGLKARRRALGVNLIATTVQRANFDANLCFDSSLQFLLSK